MYLKASYFKRRFKMPFLKTLVFLLSSLLAYIFIVYDKILNSVLPASSKGMARQPFLNYIENDVKQICYQNASQLTRFWLYTPNLTCNMRYDTFAAKEPEMFEWINEYGGDGSFYDIGANIGLYSLYYAKNHKGNVFSFEPSVFNLKQLAKNVSINAMNEKITIISNPLTNKTGIAGFVNGSDTEGGAMGAFGVDFGWDGKAIDSQFKYSLLGFSLDDLIEKNIITETPSLIKIDVAGIEHLILKGALKTLESQTLKSIYVEVNEDFHEHSDRIKAILEGAGFRLKEKRRSDLVEDTISNWGNVYNQIWIR